MKLHKCGKIVVFTRSLPVRGAWIEIHVGGQIIYRDWVAPRKGSVD